MVLAMVFSFAACSGGNDEGSVENDANVSDTKDPAVEEEENTEENIDEEADKNQAEEDTKKEEVKNEEPKDEGQKDQSSTSATVGQTLLADFKAIAGGSSAQGIADKLLQNDVIQFSGASMAVQPGLLTGFGNAEITGFSEGVMFAPGIGTIPFIGYIFVVEDGTDVSAFMSTLKSNADPRWNICTTAEETVVSNVGNKVFFLMCPKSFES